MPVRVFTLATLLALGGCATGGRVTTTASASEACFAAASQRSTDGRGNGICTAALANRAMPPGLRAATLVNRGIVALNAGRIDTAIVDFDAAIAVMPDNADAHINKGIAFLQIEGRAGDAVAILTKAIDLMPRRPELAYYHRAIANETLGQLRAAYEDFAVAAQLAPDWSEPATQLQRFKIVRRKTLNG